MAKKPKDDSAPVFSVKKPKKTNTLVAPPVVVINEHEESSKTEWELNIKKEVIPLWTAKWGKEALLEKRTAMGAREFDRGYRQRAIADEDLLFRKEWIDNALDRSLCVPDSVTKDSFWYKWVRDAGVDLAIATADKEADFFSITGIITTKDWHRWIMCNTFTRGLSFGQQVSLLVEHQDRYAFDVMTVERNGYQESIVRHIQESGVSGGKIPIRGYHTGRLSKVDLELGIPSIAVELEQGRWHIPYGDARSRRMMESTIEELRQYPSPGVHDDAVMSLFLARSVRTSGAMAKPRIHMLKW